ncbi:DUF5872 domain-containing protein [Corallococcus macrosporus]|uniref:DUF5872 domain-containing protein n=2 Tax=Myxococcaceae TaxID=31 RepID=A0A250K2T2_9BACT|nr:DUF5872 domain-containing protein [Corallococcus macrosporus]AEI68901.1 hypothetical protein LILAB_35100 [Corallococcus macrosporus]ATB49666.1 hypothetical protein MYMAC_005320 [Corallococcus macrosporus DSM 14697]
MAVRKRSRTTASTRGRTSSRGRPAARKTGTASRSTARKSASSGRYTEPELRERIKARVMRSSKGGRPGEWSARKAQLVAAEYKKAGGGYRGGRGATQKSLTSWTKEEWQTKEGDARARRGGTTARYLPKKAWEALSPTQKRATERKKREGTRRGKQFVRNTAAARTARKKTTRRR